jgi:hypothetical protein
VTLTASACTVRPSSTASNVHPADIYGADPTLPDVRSLLGDDNWWPGPPSFGVRPPDSATMPFNEKFHVITRFVRLGTADFSLFSSGAKAAILVCRATSAVEAASRACESPLSRIGPAWMLTLSGA